MPNLIITRRPGEALNIGDQIKIVIYETKGHAVKIGIDAPRDIQVVRIELAEAKQTETCED